MVDSSVEAVRGLDLTVVYCTTVSPFDHAGLREVSRLSADGVHRIVLVEPYLEGTLTNAIVSALRPEAVRIEAIGVQRQVLSQYGSPDKPPPPPPPPPSPPP